jgi:hypothetical protein
LIQVFERRWEIRAVGRFNNFPERATRTEIQRTCRWLDESERNPLAHRTGNPIKDFIVRI